jgi:NADH-quinone oxidoreductase subunit N
MSLEALKHAAASNQWAAIAPEIVLGGLAVLLLVLEMVLPRARHRIIPYCALVGQLGALAALVFGLMQGSTHFVGQTTFNGLLLHTPASEFLRVFFVLTGFLVSLLGVIALSRQKMPKVEFFHITLVVTAAMMLLAQAHNFILLFVALETVTVGFYILVSYTRTNPLSLEAGLKYLVMGALSSCLLLAGIVLLYGVVGNPALTGSAPGGATDFAATARFLAANQHDPLAALGIVLVLSGVAFKIGAVPFHIWVPDVYQGAPTPVTAFLAVGSKAAGFAVLLALVQVFAAYRELVTLVLGVFAAATIVLGNLAALTQHNIKRLLGLSGVAHAGYLLLGVIAYLTLQAKGAPAGNVLGAIYFYLFAYLLGSFAVFGVMTHCAGVDDADQTLDHYADLGKHSPFLAGVLAIGLGSLAGIPPLAGFIGKLLLFIGAYQAGLLWLVLLALVGVVISIYYYFGWIKAAFFAQWRPPQSAEDTDQFAPPARTPVTLFAGLVLALLAAGSVLLGLYQGPLLAYFTSL